MSNKDSLILFLEVIGLKPEFLIYCKEYPVFIYNLSSSVKIGLLWLAGRDL